VTDRGVDPYGTGRHPPNIYEGGGASMVMSPNILEVMSFRMSTRVSTRNYVQIPKESEWHICCILVLEKLKVKNMFLNVYFAARFILSSNSNNCCLLYFNVNIMCSFTKKSLSFCPPDPQSSFMSTIILWDQRPCSRVSPSLTLSSFRTL